MSIWQGNTLSSLSARRNLNAVALEMLSADELDISTHHVGLKNFPDTFVASDAVQWMVSSAVVDSELDAEELGQLMQKQGIIIEAVENESFGNNKALFTIDPVIVKEFQELKSAEDLRDVGVALLASGLVKSHRFLLKEYPHCFVGKEAVKWMVEKKIASSEKEATAIGCAMHVHGLIRHVWAKTGKERFQYGFKNGHFFYNFTPLFLKQVAQQTLDS